MKMIFTTLAAASALIGGSQAEAKMVYGNYAGTSEVQSQMQSQIDRGIETGVISPDEALSLRAEIGRLIRLDALYSRNGFTRSEQAELTRRGQALRDHVSMAQRSGSPQDRASRSAAAGDRVNWGILSRDNRGDRFDGDYRVGQLSSADLVPLPAEYRPIYQDDPSSYYRFNQGRIYQVDRRTNLILKMVDRDR